MEKIQSYKDTVLKTRQLKIKLRPLDDGRMDLIIPFTELLELQARKSFADGITIVTLEIAKYMKTGKFPTQEEWRQKVNEWLLIE
jgi:hypothetical protein